MPLEHLDFLLAFYAFRLYTDGKVDGREWNNASTHYVGYGRGQRYRRVGAGKRWRGDV